ncbi:MAG: phage tail assembly protein [Proteobacteria bacterium]|nr:phage tail assembly protein [Pseudomonadota bacterium]MBU1594266.1 phage tail assembly protein [Pseudomonadota bacterium]
MEAKTVTLSTPVKHGEEEITKLVFTREPKAKDMDGIPIGGQLYGEHMTKMISRLTGYPPSVIGEIGLGDFMRCGEVVGDFLSPGPQTGSGPAD